MIEQVWPLVRQARPDARLIIAGTQPENIRTYSTGAPGVEFTGFVEDLDALYQRSRIVCCPILSGGGTRVKMIESRRLRQTHRPPPGLVPKVLAMEDGRDYLQRNHAESFARACIELLERDEWCHRLGASARQSAIQQYDRANIVRTIQSHVELAMDQLLDGTKVYQCEKV